MPDQIRNHSLKGISPSNLSDVLTQSQRQVAKNTWMATLVFSLGLASGLWLTMAAHSPQIAQAQTVNLDVNIDRRPNETYESLLIRAEAAAKAAVAKNFNDRGNQGVSVTVVAHNQGAIAPVLNLKVSRSQGLSSRTTRGITYFNQARSLLRLEELATNNPAGGTNNPNSTNNRPQRNNNFNRSKQPPNSNSGTFRQGAGNSGSGFTQPGRLVPPSTPGQPTNNAPGQPGVTNNSPNGQTPPGTGLVPQSPASTPLNTQNQPSTSTPTSGSGTTPSTPSTAPGQPSTSAPTPGTGLAPQPPATAPVNNQVTPRLTPSTPSNPGFSNPSSSSPNFSNPNSNNFASPSNPTTPNSLNTPQNPATTTTGSGTNTTPGSTESIPASP